MPDQGQGREGIGDYAAKLPVCRESEDIDVGETPGGEKENPVENEGLDKNGYGCPPFRLIKLHSNRKFADAG
jgi:hypothetical protein